MSARDGDDDNREDELSESFGQHEELTNRINRLLEGYTRDASIFKELLQNADDAGATEVRFVKDLRNHSTEKLLNEKWKEMFGPALCIYNDASFTPRDMKGIQDLGEGSKEGEALKTGKYGVGFNAVYNLTDTPCFWTRVVPEPGDTAQVEEKKLGEKLCVMDPNFFVASPRARRPGQQLSVTDRFRAQYSNMLAPFLLEGTSTEAQSGTVFRLPLRTEDKASKTKIRQPAATMEEVNDLLQDFRSTMGECLLFLNNVRKIGVYTAKADGTVELDYETQLSTDEANTKSQQEFYEHVKQESKKLKSEGSLSGLIDFSSKEVSVHCRVSHGDQSTNDWLVVHRFGLYNTVTLPAELQHADLVKEHKLFPLGGVALCLSLKADNGGRPSSSATEELSTSKVARREGSIPTTAHSRSVSSHAQNEREESTYSPGERNQRKFQAFCMLPIPVTTGLPVHVNGRFALDHETRRNIDTRPDNKLTSWNQLLAQSVIVPAYVTALREVRRLCFSGEESSLCTDSAQTYRETSLVQSESGSNKKRRKTRRPQDVVKQPQKHGSLLECKDLQNKLRHYCDFFPDVEKEVDHFWKCLMTSLYKLLAEREADVFPVVRTDLDRLLWVPAVKSKGFPGYFLRHPSARSGLKHVLVHLNMNIIESPFKIHDAFINSSVQSVKTVEKETVVDFLQSCHRDDSDMDSCNLKHLPKPVEDTGFKTADGVHEIFTFIQKQDRNLDGLPLSLRMSGQLHCFTPHNPTIMSEFYSLLPGSSGLFLPSKLIPCVKLSEESPLPEYLKHFDLTVLAQRLPSILHQSMISSGLTPSLDELSSKHKDFCLSDWIKRLWCFLDDLEKNEQGQDMELLQQWCLIPAHKDGTVYLFSVRDRSDVVYIPAQTIQQRSAVVVCQNEDVNRSLDKLPLFKLDMRFVSYTRIATQTVASVNNPTYLITALTNVQEHNLNSSEAEAILDLFYRTVDYRCLASRIRLLPFFERPDGSFVAVGNDNCLLCLPDGIPHDGLNEWSNNRGISLVKRNNRLHKLFVELGIASPDREEFYCEHLLPTLSSLPAGTIPRHMEYIKDLLNWTDGTPLLHTLRQTPFIKGTDGTLSTASQFFSPYCKVFEVMMPQERFPPPPYNDYQWRSFLERVGMVSEVSNNWFLTFVRQVAEAGKTSVSSKVKQQSGELAKCLKTSCKLRGEDFLKQLKGIKFLVPLSHSDLHNGELLQSIHPLFHPPTPLISFSEGLSPDQQYLGWTSSSLLCQDADPSRFDYWEHDKHEWVGFSPQPSADLFVRHVKNVCQSLSMKDKRDTSVLNDFDDMKLTSLEHILEAIYKHLEQLPDDKLEKLHDVAVIFDRKKKDMFSPDQVVITILPEQIVDGFVTGAPEKLGIYFDLFRRLGVCETVTLDHYAMALERLQSLSHGEVLNPNDLKLVADAVHSLFSLLRGGNEQDSLSRHPLFLPGEDISMMTTDHIPQVRLIDSRQLIREVNNSQQRRLKKPIKELAVFANFRRLGLKGHHLYEVILLPGPFRMKKWYEVVREEPMESCKTLAREDSETRLVGDLLRSEGFAIVIKRLAQHQRVDKDQIFTEDDEKKIEDSLKELNVLKVTDLKTVLNYNGQELQDTQQQKNFFVAREAEAGNSSSYGSVTKVSLYINDSQLVDIAKNRNLGLSVRKAVEWAVGYGLPPVLDICLTEPLSQAQKTMDEEDIIPYELRQSVQPVTRSTVFLPPGFFVPEDMRLLLDQDVYEFKPSEYVAYELHDPILDTQCHETDDTESRDTPVYIFAKVIEVKEPDTVASDMRTRLLLLRYVIHVGEDREPKEVEASELYKFIRRTSTAVAPFTGVTTPPPAAFSQPGASDDLQAVRRDIQSQLRQIWSTMPDNKSRKRIVKRLYIKWHPDKNPDRQKFCVQVVQTIQHYVSLLELP